METVWDEPKRLSNLAKHGMNFRDLSIAFFETAIIRPSHSARCLALSSLEDGTAIVAVVFRPLGSQAPSVISMRRASPSERRLYSER